MNVMNTTAEVQAGAPRGLADVLGISAFMRVVRRRLVLILGIGTASALAAFAFMMLQPATYTASALLLISPRTPETIGTVNPLAPAPPTASPVDSEIELLRSPALMNALAQQLGMQGANPTDAAELDLASAIDVERRANTNVIEIRARSGDPARAQLIANTYADTYLTSQIDAALGGNVQESAAASERLAQLRQDAQEAESAAEAFRAQSGASGDGAADISSQVQQAQAELAERQARYQRVQQLRNSGASLDSLGAAIGSSQLNALLQRSAELNRRLEDLNQRYLPSHPDVQAATAEREDLDRRIQRDVQRATVDLADQVAAARARLESLQQAVRSAGDSLRGTSDASDRLRDLERQAAESRRLYESFLERQEAITGQGARPVDARLLAYASLPAAPTSPQLRLALAIALALGIFLGLGAAGLVELFDQSVKNADDIEAKTGAKAIASIPVISKRMLRQMPPAERHPSGYLVGRPMSAFTEALRVLRTVIVYSKLDFSVKVVAITSALPNEGKTTVSMCLARVAAMSGQKVCVVDCDLRMQSINDVIDIETDVGILQVLAGEAPWRSAIVRDPNSDAHVLPVATAGFTPRDVFGSEAMSNLIKDLREHYDLVILDCAPILAVAETRILVAQADTTVIVARLGKTPVGAMRAAVHQTNIAGGNVLGIALNCVLPNWQTFSDSLYFDQSKSYYSVS